MAVYKQGTIRETKKKAERMQESEEV